MHVLFIDVDCPEALDAGALGTRALGGTESTLFQVSEGLARAGLRVTIAQHNRTSPRVTAAGVRYIPYQHRAPLPADPPEVVVVLRNDKILPCLRRRFPTARLLLWMHCFPGRHWRHRIDGVLRTGANLVAVSHSLGDHLVEVMRPALPSWEARARVVMIPNPVSVTRLERRAAFDPDKLVFFSSPHKGLDEVLRHFAAARSEFPGMQLHLADPGYWKGSRSDFPEGVIAHGALTPAEVHRHVAEALCVFYPQTGFAETFGLVFAEANALGTPVLAHPLGAASEVLEAGGPGQVADCSEPEFVVGTLRRWREGGRPRVTACPHYRPAAVIGRWMTLLTGSATLAPPQNAA
ncbi:glycosyltransferase family 4 protein [Haloferula sargassicola]|uniref:Glycosyl transferase family 1 domain-containing protein n=1 Tax=Haloferula sargassicola TaxID=490096 RepID=A0ABP9UR12_9BACT